jgi:YVTN family beta-propeller protein
MRLRLGYALLLCSALTVAGAGIYPHFQKPRLNLPTGKPIDPIGAQTPVGSFPDKMILSESGKFLIVTNSGFRENLSVLDASSGKMVFQKAYLADAKSGPTGLYFGLATHKNDDGSETLAISHGSEDEVTLNRLGEDGSLSALRTIKLPPSHNPLDIPFAVADLAWSADGSQLYLVLNQSHAFNHFRGALLVYDLRTGAFEAPIPVGSFPLSISVLNKDWVSITNEGGREVTFVNPALGQEETVNTGEQPTYETLDHSGNRLFVSNSNSDTISEIDVATHKVSKTILVRPGGLRGFPGLTPLGSALSADDRTLYVAIADLNAIAVIDTGSGRVLGYAPTGWYPTSVAVSPDGKSVFVANAKGVQVRNPNGINVKSWGRYAPNILEGTISTIPISDLSSRLPALTQLVRRDNHDFGPNRTPVLNPGIRHVFYIIKENRTYDQILGDMKAGNGDPSLTLFGGEITPNAHALASRFGLFDNFYVNAEVSADGWNWSTSGEANEYTERNVPYNYSGRGRNYDFEGTNNGSPVDLEGRRDVATSAGGYLWDSVLAKGLSVRDYGMFVSDGEPTKGPDGKPIAEDNQPTKRSLAPYTCVDFRRFDLSFPDSDGWIKEGLKKAPRQMSAYGSHLDPCRISTWLREFKAYVERGNLPSLNLLRLMRDHTAGTSIGLSSARAMVADNDYAVGELVDAVSHSPYWNSSAIFVVEDDAQSGFDHVDCHRSPMLVISPYLRANGVSSAFYNSDSVLATIESLLRSKPNNQYLATAKLMDVFEQKSLNEAPYDAILPDKKILGEMNSRSAYRAKDSTRLVSLYDEDSAPDFELNEILWHSIKGKGAPLPQTPGVVWHANSGDRD